MRNIFIIFAPSVTDLSLCTFRSKNISSGYPVSFRVGAGPYRHRPILDSPLQLKGYVDVAHSCRLYGAIFIFFSSNLVVCKKIITFADR